MRSMSGWVKNADHFLIPLQRARVATHTFVALRRFVDARKDQIANSIQWHRAMGISDGDEASNR